MVVIFYGLYYLFILHVLNHFKVLILYYLIFEWAVVEFVGLSPISLPFSIYRKVVGC